MRAAVIALLVATIALGAWGVGELHYRNCVNAVRAAPPMTDGFTGEEIDTDARARKVAGCSRIP